MKVVAALFFDRRLPVATLSIKFYEAFGGRIYLLKYLFCGRKGVAWAINEFIYSCLIDNQTWLSFARIYVGPGNEETMADKLSGVFHLLNDVHINNFLNDFVSLGLNVDRGLLRCKNLFRLDRNICTKLNFYWIALKRLRRECFENMLPELLCGAEDSP